MLYLILFSYASKSKHWPSPTPSLLRVQFYHYLLTIKIFESSISLRFFSVEKWILTDRYGRLKIITDIIRFGGCWLGFFGCSRGSRSCCFSCWSSSCCGHNRGRFTIIIATDHFCTFLCLNWKKFMQRISENYTDSRI